MQIFDHDHERPVAREVTQKSGEGRMEPVPIGPRGCLVGGRQRGDAVRRAGDLHERTEWATRVDLRALAKEDACTVGACLLNEVTEHCGLADAGLS